MDGFQKPHNFWTENIKVKLKRACQTFDYDDPVTLDKGRWAKGSTKSSCDSVPEISVMCLFHLLI